MTSTKSDEQPSHRQNLSTKSDKQNYSRRVQVNTSFGRINITEGIMLALFIRIKKYIVYIYIFNNPDCELKMFFLSAQRSHLSH